MNDEKIEIINMVSGGIITPEEGAELLKSLCNLEDAVDMEVEDSGHLPPWESGGVYIGRASELLSQSRCALAMAAANQGIILAMQQDEVESMAFAVTALDILQLSGFTPMPRGIGGFKMSYRNMEHKNGEFHWGGGGMSGAWRPPSPKFVRAPGWEDSMLSCLCDTPGAFRLERGAEEMAAEWNKKIRMSLAIEDSPDSVNTKAGSFHDCLKARIEITGIGDFQFDQRDHLLKMIGTKSVWFAPGVGIVKLLYEHANDTRTEIELTDYYVESGEPLYFPLSSGSRWQYQWQDKWVVHKELIRVFPSEGEGKFVFGSANYMTGHE